MCATTSDNILNDVLVHLLEFGFALLVEYRILLLKLLVGSLCDMIRLDFSRHLRFVSKWDEKTRGESAH